MKTYRTFDTAEEAKTYRREHGTGGFILVCEKTDAAILFPPDMTPTPIMLHPLARGITGTLLA